MTGTATLATSVGSVAREAWKRWEESGHSAQAMRWDQFVQEFDEVKEWTHNGISDVVVARGVDSIDCLVEAYPDWPQVHCAVEWLSQHGWLVTVLTPLSELGTAHETLRGAKAEIQGWWERDDEFMRFTPHECA